jgi:hypothetical protein
MEHLRSLVQLVAKHALILRCAYRCLACSTLPRFSITVGLTLKFQQAVVSLHERQLLRHTVRLLWANRSTLARTCSSLGVVPPGYSG